MVCFFLMGLRSFHAKIHGEIVKRLSLFLTAHFFSRTPTINPSMNGPSERPVLCQPFPSVAGVTNRSRTWLWKRYRSQPTRFAARMSHSRGFSAISQVQRTHAAFRW